MKFRKKPVVIDAYRFEGDFEEFFEWVGQWLAEDEEPGMWENPDGSLTIDTLEGEHRADVGDVIIRGVQGEFYPCKPDIFEATYEVADGPETPVRGGDDALSPTGHHVTGGERPAAPSSPPVTHGRQP